MYNYHLPAKAKDAIAGVFGLDDECVAEIEERIGEQFADAEDRTCVLVYIDMTEINGPVDTASFAYLEHASASPVKWWIECGHDDEPTLVVVMSAKFFI